MNKSFNEFPNEENKHVQFLKPSLDGMKKLDTKTIEIDDRFSLFVICSDNNRYTGWFLYLQGAMPVCSFVNATLYDIVTQGYEEHIFDLMTEAQLYNEAMSEEIKSEVAEVMQKQDDVYLSQPTPPPMDVEVAHEGEPHSQDIPEKVESIAKLFQPKVFNYVFNGENEIMIHLYKSIAVELQKKYPDLKEEALIQLVKTQHEKMLKSQQEELFTEYKLNPTIHDNFNSQADLGTLNFMKEQAVKNESGKMPVSEKTVSNVEITFENQPYQNQLQGIFVETQFRDKPDTQFSN